MAAKIPQKYYFPQKNAQALNLDVFEKGWGMSLPRLGHRPKTSNLGPSLRKVFVQNLLEETILAMH